MLECFCVCFREYEKRPEPINKNDQYEDISDQENENDFKEPEPKPTPVQKDPFDDSSDREERRTPVEKQTDKKDYPSRRGSDR